MAGFVSGEISILMPLMLEVRTWSFPKPKTLSEMETITNTLNRQCLGRFLNEHSFFIHTQHRNVDDEYLSEYSISHWLCDFIFDPNRSQSLYSTSSVTSECQRAIEAFIANNRNYHPKAFFVPDDECEISDARRLLEHARNGFDSNYLLLFLRYLFKIHWFDIYTRGRGERFFTHGIMEWVCMTLVS